MDRFNIIVGIPTFNEAENVGFVVRQVDLGLREHFPDKRALIVCCDGNSMDMTKPAFLNTETYHEKMFLTTRLKGKGNGLKMLFRLAVKMKPEATVVVDADLKSINPEWVRLLAGPVLAGYDYVTPVYLRERYDGTITNHITYPIVYGLLGKNVRQPIAGDFAFSTNLTRYWLKQKWTRETCQFGIDIFMTTSAIFGGFRMCQAGLCRKIHKQSSPRLSDMFLQVVKSLFDSVLENREKWINNSEFKVEEEKLFGIRTLPEPRNIKPDPENLLQIALNEYEKDKLRLYLRRKTFQRINSMFFHRDINLDGKLWSKAIYDLMYSYFSRNDKDDIIRCMRSLYFARVYTFFKRIPEYTTEEVESEISEQAECFREMRKYLIRRLVK